MLPQVSSGGRPPPTGRPPYRSSLQSARGAEIADRHLTPSCGGADRTEAAVALPHKAANPIGPDRADRCDEEQAVSTDDPPTGDLRMTLSPISRRAGLLSLTAAVLIVLSQLMRLAPHVAVRVLVVVACGIASAVLWTTSAAADDGPDLAAIDRYVRSEMDAQRIPGLALGIVHGDRIVHVQGFGQAERSGPDVTPQTPFLIGSVTKSFTALAIMQLSEAGRVQLDAPVQRYLPWWRVADPDASTQITVRHLLYQVSGLSKATGNAYATSGDTHDAALEDRVRTLRDAELTAPVGTTWQYSNANYWTLGMIVQAVSGQSYESYIQQHIFDPLQMGNSYTSRDRGGPARPAHGPPLLVRLPRRLRTALRSRRPGVPGPQRQRPGHGRLPQPLPQPWPTWRHQLVSPAGAAELQRAGVPTGLDGVSYAMGWDVGQIHGTTAISHDGSGFDSTPTSS